MPRIRQARPADHPEIRDLLTAAFPDEDVVTLVDLVRAGPDHIPELDLVAELGGEVVGHVMASWTPLRSDAGGTRRILMVAPLSVRPDRQRTGIGRALVARLVDLARERSEPVLVLEGDPAYYGRLGFVAAGSLGIQGASPTTPDWAFQVYRITPDLPDLRGRVVYPEPIWAAEGAGLPEEHRPGGPYPVPWLFALARFSGWIEAAAARADLGQPVPACPGWSVGELLGHLGDGHRRAVRWLRDGRPPATDPPRDADLRAWFATGWRELFAALAAEPPDRPAAAWDGRTETNRRWRQRMAHEAAVHCWDLLDALAETAPPGAPAWRIEDPLALDGITEVLDLRLVTRGVADAGRPVRVTAGDRTWWVGPPDGLRTSPAGTSPSGTSPSGTSAAGPVAATVTGDPARVYLWLWGRGPADAVRVEGDPRAAASLR